jgi:hypothetical protein
MPPSRPSLHIRPRSAIADPALAREAIVDLPGSGIVRFGYGLRGLVSTVTSLGRPIEPDRVIVIMSPTAPWTGTGRRRLAFSNR